MRSELAIAYTSIGTVLFPLALAIVHWRYLPVNLKPLLWISVVSFSCDMLSFFLVRYSINTHWIGNIYLISQFFLLVLIFRNDRAKHQFVDVAAILFILFSLVNLTLFQGPWVFNSVSNVFACLILITICLSFFYRLMNELPIVHVHRLPMFW